VTGKRFEPLVRSGPVVGSSTFWYIVWAPELPSVIRVDHPQTAVTATGLLPGQA